MYRLVSMLLLVILGIFASCDHQKLHTKMEVIRSLARRCKPLEMPFKWNVELDVKRHCTVLNPATIDSFLLRELNMQVVGRLDDTSHYFGFLTLAIGDMLCPELCTFSKDGELISKTRIANCHCGGLAMSYESCYDSLTIDASGNITSISKAVIGTNQIEKLKGMTGNMITGQGQIRRNGQVDFQEGDLQFFDP